MNVFPTGDELEAKKLKVKTAGDHHLMWMLRTTTRKSIAIFAIHMRNFVMQHNLDPMYRES